MQENKVVKGQHLQSFTCWVNQALLPNHGLEPGFPCKVNCETARKWLHELEFSVHVLDAKKGTYVDSHKRDDVVEYGGSLTETMLTPEAKLALPEDLETPRSDVLTKTIVLFHDEMITSPTSTLTSNNIVDHCMDACAATFEPDPLEAELDSPLLACSQQYETQHHEEFTSTLWDLDYLCGPIRLQYLLQL